MASGARPRDETEFESLFEAHHASVFRLVFRIVGTAPDAEDVAQEAFLRLHGRMNHQSRGGVIHLKAWLYRVATHLALNARREQGRRERRHRSAAHRETAVADRIDNPIEAAVRREERESVRRILDRLPVRQSEILYLRYAGLSYREVAQAIGVAPGSVGTLLARAEGAFSSACRESEMAARGRGRTPSEPAAQGEKHGTRIRDRV